MKACMMPYFYITRNNFNKDKTFEQDLCNYMASGLLIFYLIFLHCNYIQIWKILI